MANDHIIADDRFPFVVINVKAVKYYLAARKYGMQNGTLTSWAVQYTPVALLYSTLLELILRLRGLVCCLSIML